MMDAITKIGACGIFVLVLSACVAAEGQSKASPTDAQTHVETNVSEIVEDALSTKSQWAVITDESHVQFSATQTGNRFTGHFKTFTADIQFDPANIDTASVTARIDLASAEAGSSERDDALPGKDWFFVKSFPEAVFMSDDFMQTGEATYEARGTLDLRGVSQDVTLPFTLNIDGSRADMSGTVSLNRQDYGVGQGEWASDEWVGYAVDVDIKIAATRSP